MAILFLLLAIIAIILGFVGLVTIIKGFVYKNNKNINLGTVLVCVMLIIAVSGAFCVGKRALNSKRYHDNERRMMFDKCANGCDFGMMKDCCMGDTTATTDSNGVAIVTKVIVDKQCMMKDKPKCCPNKKK